jgi:hypothetical protein
MSTHRPRLALALFLMIGTGTVLAASESSRLIEPRSRSHTLLHKLAAEMPTATVRGTAAISSAI